MFIVRLFQRGAYQAALRLSGKGSKIRLAAEMMPKVMSTRPQAPAPGALTLALIPPMPRRGHNGCLPQPLLLLPARSGCSCPCRVDPTRPLLLHTASLQSGLSGQNRVVCRCLGSKRNRESDCPAISPPTVGVRLSHAVGNDPK